MEELESFLITCEGEKTEPNYFKRFRVSGKVIEVKGLGDHTFSLVKKTIELKAKKAYDQTWVVLDRDSFPVERFNNALNLAKENRIQVAYSNEAFELWYLLHFNYYNTSMCRDQFSKMLSRLMGRPYKKNSAVIYDQLLQKQSTAIKNATRLLTQYPNPKPVDNNPSTTVHLLVKELVRNSR